MLVLPQLLGNHFECRMHVKKVHKLEVESGGKVASNHMSHTKVIPPKSEHTRLAIDSTDERLVPVHVASIFIVVSWHRLQLVKPNNRVHINYPLYTSVCAGDNSAKNSSVTNTDPSHST